MRLRCPDLNPRPVGNSQIFLVCVLFVYLFLKHILALVGLKLTV